MYIYTYIYNYIHHILYLSHIIYISLILYIIYIFIYTSEYEIYIYVAFQTSQEVRRCWSIKITSSRSTFRDLSQFVWSLSTSFPRPFETSRGADGFELNVPKMLLGYVYVQIYICIYILWWMVMVNVYNILIAVVIVIIIVTYISSLLLLQYYYYSY